MSNLDELREFIELWIPINVKDAQHVKEAKIEARKEFLDKVSQYTQQETLKARTQLAKDLLRHYPEVPSLEQLEENLGEKERNWAIDWFFNFDLFGGELHRLSELTTNKSKEK